MKHLHIKNPDLNFKAINKILMVIPFIFPFLLSSCAHNPVKTDLIDYLNNHILRIADLETMSLARYGMVIGQNYKDDKTLEKTLNDYVIPNYGRFLNMLREIRPSTEDIQRLHRHYIEGATHLYEGFRTLRLALEKQDPNLVKIANNRITEGSMTVVQWKETLNGLAETHKIKIQAK